MNQTLIMSLPTFIANNVSNYTAATMQSDEYVPHPWLERPDRYIVPILFSIIFVVGVIGNGTLIVIFLKHRSMRNIPNT